ncbi:MAG: hypothetical protein QNJ62_09910 [Methyloceanibacter sp.]|nr:hypothetical protein [Methyloceanibacter sp.]
MTKIGTTAALTVFTALTVLSVSLSAVQAQVSDAVREACARKANKVTPPLRAGEREAYITNCIADAAPAAGKSKKKRY